jgi:hypothetical protein
MSNRRTHTPNSATVKCNVCGVVAVSTPGKRHRRCSGQPGNLIRNKHDTLPSAVRGTWM